MSLKGVYPPSSQCQHCATSQSTTVHMWTPVTAEAGGEEHIHTCCVCVCVFLFLYLCEDQLKLLEPENEDINESEDIWEYGFWKS